MGWGRWGGGAVVAEAGTPYPVNLRLHGPPLVFSIRGQLPPHFVGGVILHLESGEPHEEVVQ